MTLHCLCFESFCQVLASGDSSGLLTIWSLDEQDGEGALVPQVFLYYCFCWFVWFPGFGGFVGKYRALVTQVFSFH